MNQNGKREHDLKQNKSNKKQKGNFEDPVLLSSSDEDSSGDEKKKQSSSSSSSTSDDQKRLRNFIDTGMRTVHTIQT